MLAIGFTAAFSVSHCMAYPVAFPDNWFYTGRCIQFDKSYFVIPV
jgi:hypothetical protein